MKTVTIKHGCLGRYDDVSPFLVEDGTLALHFVLPRVSGEFYFVVWNSFDGGQSQRTIKIPATGDVELEGLNAGEIHGCVKHYFRGECVEEFQVEPLLVKDVDGGVRAFPEIEALRKELTATGEAAEKQREADAEAIGKLIGELREEVHRLQTAFLSYAWAEYQSDIRLNGKSLSLSEFVCALGCGPEQLSEEEIEKIKNFKEEL